ncbi:MAG: apolipoprotein N-acyltransferase, partial [Akkermansiaceae bacterium]|nr:apolipoprotein N-acyltransferase [Akkermansiaceae bacterium]
MAAVPGTGATFLFLVNASAKFFVGLLAAAATGAGMVLLLPPFHFGSLVWVVFVPVLLFLWSLGEKKRFRKAFVVGLCAGSVGFLGLFSWLQTVTVLGWAVVSVYLALFPAFWAGMVATLADPRREPQGNTWSGSVRRAFWVAALWCGFEWLRGWLFTGFGWNGIGVAFHQTPIFAQSADLFGIVGLSFLPVFVQAIGVQALLRLFSKEPAAAKRQPHYDLAVAICLVAAAFGYGRWRIFSYGKAESIRLKTLLVQLDIKQEQTRRLADPLQIPIDYEDETIGALQSVPAERKPDWVILPESALDGRILRMPDESWGMANENFETLRHFGEEGSFTTIMGLVEVEGEKLNDQIAIKKDSRYWNSMAVFARDGSLQTFKKHHLVIFGEWIPFVEEIPLLKKIL